MLKSLRIKQFKSHKDTFLDFDKGLNVIHGISTTGKSAMMNAIRLLFENRPLGAHYFSDFAGDKGATEVSVELMEGGSVSLFKSIRVDKDGNKSVVSGGGIYTVNGSEYSCPKEGLPDQVSSALKIGELNLQRQFDAPFLVMSPPGENARMVNRITKLEKTDDWVASLTSKINQGNRDVLSIEAEIKQAEIELKKYDRIEELEILVYSLSEIDKEIPELDRRVIFLSEQIENLSLLGDELEVLKEALTVEKYLTKAENISMAISACESLSGKVKTYKDYSVQADCLGKVFNDLSEMEKLLSESEYDDFEDSYLKLADGIRDYSVLARDLSDIGTALSAESWLVKAENMTAAIVSFERLIELVGECVDYKTDLQGMTEQITEIKEQYAEALQKMGRCPTCESVVSSKMIEKILRKA